MANQGTPKSCKLGMATCFHAPISARLATNVLSSSNGRYEMRLCFSNVVSLFHSLNNLLTFTSMQKVKEEWRFGYERNNKDDFKKIVNQGLYQSEQNIATSPDDVFKLYEPFCRQLSLDGARGLYVPDPVTTQEQLVVKPWNKDLKKPKTFMRDLQRMPYGALRRILERFLQGKSIPHELVQVEAIEFIGGKKNRPSAWDILKQDIAFERYSITLKTWMHYWEIKFGLSEGALFILLLTQSNFRVCCVHCIFHPLQPTPRSYSGVTLTMSRRGKSRQC
jgi:hypothetical protein